MHSVIQVLNQIFAYLVCLWIIAVWCTGVIKSWSFVKSRALTDVRISKTPFASLGLYEINRINSEFKFLNSSKFKRKIDLKKRRLKFIDLLTFCMSLPRGGT